MAKGEIAALQREINDACGLNLVVDDVYGPKTAKAYQHYINSKTPSSVSTPVPPAPKPWWQSKTAIFSLATIFVSIAALAGVDVDQSQLVEVITSALTLVTGLLALWSNARRRAPIDSTLIAPGVRIAAPAHTMPSPGKTDPREPPGPFGY